VVDVDVGGDWLRLSEMARCANDRLAVSDFALMRQSRWREAIASIFDDPTTCRTLRRCAYRGDVRHARRDGRARSTNLVKPVYHVALARLALGLHVVEAARRRVHGSRRCRTTSKATGRAPGAGVPSRRGGRGPMHRAYGACPRSGLD
jgi:hypothetical protein